MLPLYPSRYESWHQIDGTILGPANIIKLGSIRTAESGIAVSQKANLEDLQKSTIGHDAPVRLTIAAKRFFPDGSMTVSGLRREVKKGNLTVERIAGKDYTTANYIAEMRSRCRVEVKALAFGSNRLDGTSKETSQNAAFGSSEMDRSNAALDAAKARVRKLKDG